MSTTDVLHQRSVLGIVGSLRAASYNARLAHVAAEIAPARLRIVVDDDRRLLRLPLYDEDLEAGGFPDEVTAMHDAIRDADGLVIATPEYNFGTPAPVKNLIDWASRPPGRSPLTGKPILLMGASTSQTGGTVQAQSQLRISLSVLGAELVPTPPVLISNAKKRLSEAGLTDETAQFILSMALDRLLNLIDRVAIDADKEAHK